MKLLGPADLAAAVTGPGGRRCALLDEVDVKLNRFCQARGRFSIDGLSHNVLTVQRGAGTRVAVRIDGKVEQVAWRHGALSLVPAAAPLTAEWEGTNDLVSLWLAPSLCARVLEIATFAVSPTLAVFDEPIAQLLGTLAGTVEQGEPFGRLYREGLLVALIACIAASHCRVDPVVRGGLATFKRRRVVEYIEANLADDIRLRDLAALADMSEHHFCTSFKRSVGFPPHRYIVERRLLAAKRLLTGRAEASVTAVAMQCGFKSSAHFATAFRKRFGSTPTHIKEGRSSVAAASPIMSGDGPVRGSGVRGR